jgi:hypothetical protein
MKWQLINLVNDIGFAGSLPSTDEPHLHDVCGVFRDIEVRPRRDVLLRRDRLRGDDPYIDDRAHRRVIRGFHKPRKRRVRRAEVIDLA